MRQAAALGAALAVLAGGPALGAEPTRRALPVEGLSVRRLARIDEVLNRHIAAGHISGAVVAVNRRGKLVHHAALGVADPATGAPMREDAIFQMYSSTKPLTAAAVLILVEEGKLRLEDPVSRYIPEFKGARVAVRKAGDTATFVPRAPDAAPPPFDLVPAARDLTIRDLLTHVGGLASSDPRRVGMTLPPRSSGDSLADYARKLAAVPLDYQPGTRWSYSPTAGCDVLAGIVEIVSGQRFDAFLSERVLLPLGMTDTHFNLPREKADRLAVVYSASPDGVKRAPAPGAWEGSGFVGQGHHVDGPRLAFSGGAGLLSTAGDYARFLEMLRRGGELDGKRYLSRKSVELMTRSHLGQISYQQGAGFGLGFRIITDLGANGRPGSEGEYSWGGAYHSTYWVDPEEDLTVVFLTQLIPAGQIDDHGKLRALLYQALD